MLQINSVNNGNCLELMSDIDDKSIDMILCDLPYGTTACKWDSVIPFEPLWEQYRRIAKKNAAIVLTASQPFSSVLVASHLAGFKHEWIWQKEKGVGFQVAKYRPMQEHEHVLVFTRNGETLNYHPIKEPRAVPIRSRGASTKSGSSPLAHLNRLDLHYTDKYPTSIKRFPRDRNGQHPTQKPVALFEYLIKTYTNDGELVLDNCAGSGTTAIACLRTNRNYILIEQEGKYCDIANKRIAEFIP